MKLICLKTPTGSFGIYGDLGSTHRTLHTPHPTVAVGPPTWHGSRYKMGHMTFIAAIFGARARQSCFRLQTLWARSAELLVAYTASPRMGQFEPNLGGGVVDHN